MANKDMTLTSVKIQSDLFETFKIECVKRKFSFQKLADRAIHLYLTDESFRKTNQQPQRFRSLINDRRLYSKRATKKYPVAHR
jgi:hypothetical protein